MLSAIFTVLMVIALLLSASVTCSLFMWWRGASSIVLPGLGLIIATPLITVLLIVVEFLVVIVAGLLAPHVISD